MQIYNFSDLTREEKLAFYQNSISTIPTLRRNVGIPVLVHNTDPTVNNYQGYVIGIGEAAYDSSYGTNILALNGLNTTHLRDIMEVNNTIVSFDDDTNLVISEIENPI